jgi:hypothetical protein
MRSTNPSGFAGAEIVVNRQHTTPAEHELLSPSIKRHLCRTSVDGRAAVRHSTVAYLKSSGVHVASTSRWRPRLSAYHAWGRVSCPPD